MDVARARAFGEPDQVFENFRRGGLGFACSIAGLDNFSKGIKNSRNGLFFFRDEIMQAVFIRHENAQVGGQLGQLLADDAFVFDNVEVAAFNGWLRTSSPMTRQAKPMPIFQANCGN